MAGTGLTVEPWQPPHYVLNLVGLGISRAAVIET